MNLIIVQGEKINSLTEQQFQWFILDISKNNKKKMLKLSLILPTIGLGTTVVLLRRDGVSVLVTINKKT